MWVTWAFAVVVEKEKKSEACMLKNELFKWHCVYQACIPRQIMSMAPNVCVGVCVCMCVRVEEIWLKLVGQGLDFFFFNFNLLSNVELGDNLFENFDLYNHKPQAGLGAVAVVKDWFNIQLANMFNSHF